MSIQDCTHLIANDFPATEFSTGTGVAINIDLDYVSVSGVRQRTSDERGLRL